MLHSRGDKWQTDSCTECECVAGSEVRCVTTECDTSMPCWQVADQHNQCCPQCQGKQQQQQQQSVLLSYCIVKACNTRGGLKREGDTWLESGQVVTCRDHFVEPVNCQTVCSNHIDSLECQLCTSSGEGSYWSIDSLYLIYSIFRNYTFRTFLWSKECDIPPIRWLC